MKDIIILGKNDFLKIRGHLVQKIEILPEAKGNLIISNEKITSFIITYYQSYTPQPTIETNQFAVFNEEIKINQELYFIDFILRYRSGTIIIERISLEIK